MKRIILDSREFNNKEQFHDIIKDKLDFPEYYGKNLDALWDCLTGWIDLPLKLEWHGFNESKSKLGDYAEKILDVFHEAEEELEGFKFEVIVDARQ